MRRRGLAPLSGVRWIARPSRTADSRRGAGWVIAHQLVTTDAVGEQPRDRVRLVTVEIGRHVVDGLVAASRTPGCRSTSTAIQVVVGWEGSHRTRSECDTAVTGPGHGVAQLPVVVAREKEPAVISASSEVWW